MEQFAIGRFISAILFSTFPAPAELQSDEFRIVLPMGTAIGNMEMKRLITRQSVEAPIVHVLPIGRANGTKQMSTVSIFRACGARCWLKTINIIGLKGVGPLY